MPWRHPRTPTAQPAGPAVGAEPGFFWVPPPGQDLGLAGNVFTSGTQTTIGDVPFTVSKTFTVVLIMAAPTGSTANGEILRIGGGSDGIRLDITTSAGGINPIVWTANGVANLTGQTFGVSPFSTAPLVAISSWGPAEANVWTGPTAPYIGIDRPVQSFAYTAAMNTPTTRTVRIQGGAARYVYGVIVLPRRMSDAEARQRIANPWSLFTPPRRTFVPRVAAGGAFTLQITAGGYSLSGQSVGLRSTRSLAVTQGAYSLTGQSVGLGLVRRLTATSGSYSLAGQSVGLAATRRLTVTAGTYTLSGQSVDLDATRILDVTAGAYSLAGQSVNLTYTSANTLAITAGAYSLSGQSVGLAATRRLTVTSGGYTLTGNSVGLTFAVSEILRQPFRRLAQPSSPDRRATASGLSRTSTTGSSRRGIE